MNVKPATNPMKSVHQFNSLYAHSLIMLAILLISGIPELFGAVRHIFVYVLLGVYLLIFIRMFFASRDVAASQKHFFESGDYCDEAIDRGLRYGWLAIFIFMSLLMLLERFTELNITAPVITRLSMAIIAGIPATAYLLLTREDRQESEA